MVTIDKIVNIIQDAHNGISGDINRFHDYANAHPIAAAVVGTAALIFSGVSLYVFYQFEKDMRMEMKCLDKQEPKKGVGGY